MGKEILQELYTRIGFLDANAPYVWRLAMTSAEFQALEAAVMRQSADGVSSLLTHDWARRCLVYLAEWYKRCYSGNDSHPAVELSSTELEQLWNFSGFAPRFLYTQENGNTSWRYSTYVLGGLAIPFELSRKDDRTLKELCRLYHGEGDCLDNLDEADRAAAFRQSISRKDSLYAYLKTILEGSFPFAAEEGNDSASPVRQFIERVKHVNDEVLRSKFRLEWRIYTPVDSPQTTRTLRLHLKPEEVGGGLHQYLRCDRLHAWGMEHPEQHGTLNIFVYFLHGKQRLATPTSDTPVITYCATGDGENSFLAWGVQKSVTLTDIPAESFDSVEIVAVGDKGVEHVAETITVEEWMQLFRVDASVDEWPSEPNPQHESALLCSGNCQMLEVAENEVVVRREIVNGTQNTLPCQWRHIYEYARFKDSSGYVHTLFNRQGYDLITTRLHSGIIRYSTAGTVTCLKWDDELGDYLEEALPLLLGKNDVIIRHFSTRNDLQDDRCELVAQPEKIEFKQGGGYIEWDGETQPRRGKLTLRIAVKGRTTLFPVYYFPEKIERDFQHCQIRIGETVFQDAIPMDGIPLEAVMQFEEGDEREKVRLEVWRPVLHREIIRDDVVARYVQPSQRASLPYILKDDVTIQDFSEDGYRLYHCLDLSGIFALPEFSAEGNHTLLALQTARKEAATQLDPYAPDWLDVCLTVPMDEHGKTASFCHWNYFTDQEPEPAPRPDQCADNEIVFFNLKDSPGIDVYPYALGDFNAWEYQEDKMDVVKCFEVAVKYRLYFLAMLPLRESLKDYVGDLYKPLLERRNGDLTKNDVNGLKRLAEEFGFDWGQLGVALV